MLLGVKALWLWVGTMAALLFLAEVIMVDEINEVQFALCAASLAVMGFAIFKLWSDG